MVWQQLLPSSQQREEEAVCKRTKKPAQWLWNVWKIKSGTCLCVCACLCVLWTPPSLTSLFWVVHPSSSTPDTFSSFPQLLKTCDASLFNFLLSLFFVFVRFFVLLTHAHARRQAGTTLTPQLATVTRWLAPPLPRLRNHGAVLALKTVGEEGRWRVSCMRFWLGIR